ncbi:MAG: gliding motility-associated lipoprotein GldH [Bacteroidetes bacterium]|nr:gliding motility-associated lipoprotein GldH [Bacteroidota bacterium]
MKASNFIALIVLLSLLTACNQNEVYFSYQTLPHSGWNKDSLLTFDVNIKDNSIPYNMYVNIRHQGSYPYQNLWLFLQNKDTKGVIQKDTIECFLADEFGKWLGSGAGALKEMPILYKQQIHFPDSGTYQLKIGQGMRDSILNGINDIGLRVEKAN